MILIIATVAAQSGRLSPEYLIVFFFVIIFVQGTVRVDRMALCSLGAQKLLSTALTTGIEMEMPTAEIIKIFWPLTSANGEVYPI